MKQCQICQKKSMRVWRRVQLRATKFNPTKKRSQRPNLQWVKIPLETKKPAYKKFAGQRILACTKCIKTLSKIK